MASARVTRSVSLVAAVGAGDGAGVFGCWAGAVAALDALTSSNPQQIVDRMVPVPTERWQPREVRG
jgi:hypothetical protein